MGGRDLYTERSRLVDMWFGGGLTHKQGLRLRALTRQLARQEMRRYGMLTRTGRERADPWPVGHIYYGFPRILRRRAEPTAKPAEPRKGGS